MRYRRYITNRYKRYIYPAIITEIDKCYGHRVSFALSVGIFKGALLITIC